MINPTLDMPIADIAASVSALLTPYLPYLIKLGQKAGGKAVEEIGKKVGEDVWAHAKLFWGRIQPKIAQSREAENTVTSLAAKVETAIVEGKPKEVEKAANVLEFEIERLLKSNHELAQSIAELIKDAQDKQNGGTVFNIENQIANVINNIGSVGTLIIN